MNKMSLLQEWRAVAYEQEKTPREDQLFWASYFNIEKGIYEQLLEEPNTVVEGTVEELAAKYNTDLSIMVGFLDGINDSLKNPNSIEEMEASTKVNLGFDLEKLYFNMVGAKADWLYELPAWDNLLPEEKRKELFRNSKTVRYCNQRKENWKKRSMSMWQR
jgi:hypothetical protein